METNDGETVQKDKELTVDLSKQSLKRLERVKKEHQSVTTLILDYNEIQKLDNLETYPNLKKLSIVSNQLIRMYSLSALGHLVELDLSQNSIVSIEGLKEMADLRILKLARNKIKTIEHLNNNLNLEVLDLSENKILRISDISYLINLEELYLHGNRIVNLTHCEKKLPITLKILTLNDNCLTDLNEISHLSCFTSLKELCLANNPCLNFSENQKCNYRPFVKNWCSNLVVLDYCPLDDIECLKAEWLYSQGRGRSFKVGEHAALVEYLVSVCPREKEENAETEDVKKLKLILSKAQLHQQQLREQLTAGETFKSPNKKKISVISERMVSSFQDTPARDMKSFSCDLMTQSLDSSVIKKFTRVKPEPNQTPLQTSTSFVPIPDTLISPDVAQPIVTCTKTHSLSSRTSRSSSRNSPLSTPENKRRANIIRSQCENSSPVGGKTGEKLNHSSMSAPLDLTGAKIFVSKSFIPLEKKAGRAKAFYKNYKETSEEEDSEALKGKVIRLKGNQKKNRVKNSRIIDNEEEKETNREKTLIHLEGNSVNINMWKAAVCIQRRWRGYRARNLNQEVLSGCKDIQLDRIQNYLRKILTDMESTRVALDGNRKLILLQMQAINALWKKTLGQSVGSESNDSKITLQDLMETCSTLNKQVEALQVVVKNLQSSSTSSVQMSTQTEIVAVHSPQDEARVIFPFSQSLNYMTFCEPSSNSVADGEEEVINESITSVNSATTVTITEIYTTADANKKEFSDMSIDCKEFSRLTDNLTKPTANLNKQNDESPTLSNELEKPETNSTIQSSCES